MGDRCTGACCERFYLPYSPTEMSRMRTAILAGKKTFKGDRGNTHLVGKDGVFIADMIKHLGLQPDKQGDLGHFYTCKHYDKAAGNCTVYEQRPSMCSEYPYGHPCTYDACQWDAGKAGEYPPKRLIEKIFDADSDEKKVLDDVAVSAAS